MPHRIAKEKLPLLEKIKRREPLTPYSSVVKKLTNDELQKTRDVYKAPIAGPTSQTYEEWITEDKTRDTRALEALNILKSEIATRRFRESKGLPAGPIAARIRRTKDEPPSR